MDGTIRKRVLVTGGAGFIGSHLCTRLVITGDDVICLDNYFTGIKDNVAALMAEPNFELLRHDVTFPLYAEVDEIFNISFTASTDMMSRWLGIHIPNFMENHFFQIYCFSKGETSLGIFLLDKNLICYIYAYG